MATSTSSNSIAPLILGVDTGGTFTDFVLLQAGSMKVHKVLSTPNAPEQAILQGINELGINQAVATGAAIIIHGSTVATNAALEGKGVATAFVTNTGFKDMLSIGRQTRQALYNLKPAAKPIPVEEPLCFEINTRVDNQGHAIEPLTPSALHQLKQQLENANVESVAVNLLFSFLNNEAEQQIKEALRDRWFVSVSHEVLPESGEYERGIATWLNASLGPKVKHYLERLQNGVSPSPLAIMQSTGGTMDASHAGNFAVNMLLSGPAGGLAAAQFLAHQTGHHRLLTFDMGGTSTDVALIDHKVQLTNESHIGPWPVAVPQVDMHTIGAGGGSIAYCDEGGMLQVGPQSAGAQPGPACYGQGGTQPTVTDANALLGRLQPEYFLGGNMDLDLAAAETAMGQLAKQLNLSTEQTALGIIRIANEHMVRALRVISIERGHHLDDFHLCCFGGAGGLHVCALADALEIKQAIVPNKGGVLSALGMVVAEKSRQLSHSLQGSLLQYPESELTARFDALAEEGIVALEKENIQRSDIHSEFSMDLRYQGQRFYLNLPWKNSTAQIETAFHQLHEQRFGHKLDIPVELVNVRCQVSAPGAVNSLPKWQNKNNAQAKGRASLVGYDQPIAIYWRDDIAAHQTIEGPALIAETVSTTLVEAQWRAVADDWGNLILNKLC